MQDYYLRKVDFSDYGMKCWENMCRILGLDPDDEDTMITVILDEDAQ